MKILKIIDGHITNSSTISTTVIVALKKGKSLSEMLEKIGLSSEFTSRFDEYGSYDEELDRWIDKGYIDSNIFDLKDTYEVLQAEIITDGFGDAYDREDRSDFRKKFYDKIKINDLPRKLDGKDFILLHRTDGDLEYEHEIKEVTRNRVWFLIEQLKNPNSEIKPRHSKNYEVKKSLEVSQKKILEEFETLMGTKFPVAESITIVKVDDFIASVDNEYKELLPEVYGFITKGKDVVALGINFRMAKRNPKVFPTSIANLPALKILDLNYFKWIKTPEIFGNLDSIEILKLPYETQFNTPPDSIGKINHLKRLFISDCKGKILPETLGNLTNLEVLVLEHNNSMLFRRVRGGVPTVIPDSIGQLGALRVLRLKGDNIESLPESIGHLKNLQYLNLYGNYISNLPKTFGNLEELQYLILRNNPLSKLPSTMLNLKNLKVLWIDTLQMDKFKEDPATLDVINEFRKKNVKITIIS